MKYAVMNNITNGIATVFILLFTYTAYDKLMNIHAFNAALNASAFLASFAAWLPWAIVITEIIAVVLLVALPLRLLGMYISFGLMTLFTTFIGYMLVTSSDLPCSCGGIINGLSWKSHLIVNIVLTFLAAYGLILETKKLKMKSIQPT